MRVDVLLSYLYSGFTEILGVEISFLSIFAANSDARTAEEVFAVAASASLLVAATFVEVAVIRTASGTTFTLPWAFTVMYRLVAAWAAGEINPRDTSEITAITDKRLRIVINEVSPQSL
jgi:hypothetical protein